MDRRQLVAGGAAAALVTVATLMWVLLSPSWSVRALDQAAQQQLGPQFFSQGQRPSGLFAPLAPHRGAPHWRAPPTGATAWRRPPPSSFPSALASFSPAVRTSRICRCAMPTFALLINERGEASWDFPDAKPGARAEHHARAGILPLFRCAKQPGAGALQRRWPVAARSRWQRQFQRNRRHQFATWRGSTWASNACRASMRMARPSNWSSKPMRPRQASAGRLSTAKVLGLTGPLSLTSRDPAMAARWAGLPLADGMALPGPLTLDGGLDSAGRAYAIRNATITLRPVPGAGDVVADLRGERPKLQANLEAEALWLDTLVPASGPSPAAGGARSCRVALLRAFDAEVSILVAGRVLWLLPGGRLTPRRHGEGRKARCLGRLPPRDRRNGVLHHRARLGGTSARGHPSPSRRRMPTWNRLISALTGVRAIAGRRQFRPWTSAHRARPRKNWSARSRARPACRLSAGRLAGIDVGGIVSAVRERILEGWNAAPGGTPLTSAERQRGHRRWLRNALREPGGNAAASSSRSPARPISCGATLTSRRSCCRPRRHHFPCPSRQGQLGSSPHLSGHSGHPDQSRKRLCAASHNRNSARQLKPGANRGIIAS